MQSLLEILGKCETYFASKGVPNAKLDAQLLLAKAMGCKRLELYLNFDKPVDESKLAQFREFARRRAAREPLQHILGDTDFCGLKIKCDARALVPRFETEELCEIVFDKIFPDPTASLRILDLGTGSGAIAAAMAKHYPSSSVEAVDFSDAAISLARENFETNEITNVRCYKSDWFSEVDGIFDLIVSNPPYLTDSEVDSAEPEVRCDPRNALVSKDGGISDLRGIISASAERLNRGGVLICECGIKHPEILAEEFRTLFGSVATVKDSSGRFRFFIARNI